MYSDTLFRLHESTMQKDKFATMSFLQNGSRSSFIHLIKVHIHQSICLLLSLRMKSLEKYNRFKGKLEKAFLTARKDEDVSQLASRVWTNIKYVVKIPCTTGTYIFA